MNFSSRKQSQFELFPGSAAQSPQTLKPRYPFQELILPPENLIVVCIALLMAFVLFYSMGVERGKRLSVSSATPKNIALQNKTSAIIAPQLKTAQPKQTPVEAVARQSMESAVSPAVKGAKPAGAVTTGQQQLPVNQPKPWIGFTVQVASFKFERNALREAEILKKTGHDAIILAKGDHFIVCVGQFAEKVSAEKFTSRLKSRYKDSMIRRL